MAILDSYLFFDGNCAEAMRFYERTLGGKLQGMMTYGQGPHAHGPGSDDRIMHASLMIDGRNLMASDFPPGQPAAPMGGFGLSLFYGTPEEASRIFDAMTQGGTVQVPINETFWARAFGMGTDRFGTPWMVSGGAKLPPV